jgi:hypothetical protein
MSAMREELHHLMDELPEAEVRPVLEPIRGRADASHGVRDLPFFESDSDLAERSEEIPAGQTRPLTYCCAIQRPARCGERKDHHHAACLALMRAAE